MLLLFKASIGALVVLLVSAISRYARNVYLAGLVPFFPTFTLIAHYIVGKERSHADLKATILFSMYSMLPLMAYLVAVYILVDKMRLEWALISAALVWLVVAGILFSAWNCYYSIYK